jgi:hypothetical protein
MREIMTHKTHEQDRQPKVLAVGNIGPGFAEQNYIVRVVHNVCTEDMPLRFMSLEVGGVTNEALLAIVIDRLEGFQAGPFACSENFTALTNAQAALEALQARTRDRLARGVERQAKA